MPSTCSLKAALCGLYKYLGLAALEELLLRSLGRQGMTILLFHRVTDVISEDGLTVGVDHFRAICRLLARSFHVVPLGEVFRTVREHLPIRPRTVAITFDDCYRDNLTAARILAEHGLPACFFVPTAYVETDHVFPWDVHLPRLPNLTWDEVREMQRMGFDIGSHTVTHPDMGRLGEEAARQEMVESKKTLEHHLGRPVRWLAYPFGGEESWQPRWTALAQEAGYEGCLSGHGGVVRAGSDHRLLPREPVCHHYGMLYLELYLRGCLGLYRGLKHGFMSAETRVRPVGSGYLEAL